MKFSIKLQTNFWNATPIIDIIVNNEQVLSLNDFETDKEKIINFETDISNKNNELIIQRKGKKLKDTIVSNGEIIKDSVVDVNDIIIDKINIKPLLTKANFYPEYPEPWLSEQKQSNKTPPEYYSFTTKLHHNGQWKLNFSNPVHIWFFQNINVQI